MPDFENLLYHNESAVFPRSGNVYGHVQDRETLIDILRLVFHYEGGRPEVINEMCREVLRARL